MINLFGERAGPDRLAVAQIKQWACEAFQLTPDAHLMVTELRCSEPDCPPVETVIAVLVAGHSPRQYKIHKAAGDVARPDVFALAQSTAADQDGQ